MEYKLSANTIEQIASFLLATFSFQFEEKSAMLNQADALVYIGKIPNEINVETGEIISYLEGFHFDIQAALNLELPEGITRHFPTNPRHQFA